jgi:hypothetical protein
MKNNNRKVKSEYFFSYEHVFKKGNKIKKEIGKKKNRRKNETDKLAFLPELIN